MQIRTALDLGLVIRQRRRELRLNQAELAERIGVGRQWVVAIEQGKARAELGLVLRALASLNLNLTINGESHLAKDTKTGGPVIDIDAIVEAAKGAK